MPAGDRRPEERQARPYRRPPTPPRGVARAQTTAEFAALVERLMSTRETKAFFRTSEFSLWFVAVIGALIAAAISATFDAAGAWNAIAVLTAGYILSRGISKAGTSRGSDRFVDLIQEERSAEAAPTDTFSARTGETPLRAPDDLPAEAIEDEGPVGSAGVREPVERFAEAVATIETKEFFLTSEFVLWLLSVIAVLIASAITAGFGATAAWTLITVLSGGYVLSRGIAKASISRGFAGYVSESSSTSGAGAYPEISSPETKEFFLTSEFWVMLLTAAGILIASGIDFGFDASAAWRLLTALGVTYMISRGISKIGTSRDGYSAGM